MTRSDWLKQLKEGDTVIPYVGRNAMAPETVTRATKTLIFIGRHAHTMRFRRTTGDLAGKRQALVTRMTIGRPDEELPSRQAPDRLKAESVDSMRVGFVDEALRERYRLDAWPVSALLERCPDDAGVYLLWKDARLLYVGSSVTLSQRVTAHRNKRRGTAGEPTHVTTIVTVELEAARALENRLIEELLPEENKVVLV